MNRMKSTTNTAALSKWPPRDDKRPDVRRVTITSAMMIRSKLNDGVERRVSGVDGGKERGRREGGERGRATVGGECGCDGGEEKARVGAQVELVGP